MPKLPTPLAVIDDLPETAQAASIALAVMRAIKAPVWSEVGELPPDVVLSDDQIELLHRHAGVLSWLRLGERGVSPMVSIAVCSSCGQWMPAGRSPIGQRCRMTAGCTGTPRKVQPAKRGTVDPDSPASADDMAEVA